MCAHPPTLYVEPTLDFQVKSMTALCPKKSLTHESRLNSPSATLAQRLQATAANVEKTRYDRLSMTRQEGRHQIR